MLHNSLNIKYLTDTLMLNPGSVIWGGSRQFGSWRLAKGRSPEVSPWWNSLSLAPSHFSIKKLTSPPVQTPVTKYLIAGSEVIEVIFFFEKNLRRHQVKCTVFTPIVSVK